MSTATQTPVTTSALEQFAAAVREMLNRATEQQGDAIQAAGALVFRTLELGGLVHAFGTGHSHLLAEEIYSRAGGLLPVNVIQSAPLMLHEDAVASGDWERLPGVAAVLLEHAAVDPARDTLIVISNSGRNAVPVEAAEWARARRVPIIAVMSLAHSRSQSSLAPSGKKLYELADVVLDNAGMPGDSLVEVRPGLRVAATSTIVGAFLLHSMVLSAVEKCFGGRHPSACSDLGQPRWRARGQRRVGRELSGTPGRRVRAPAETARRTDCQPVNARIGAGVMPVGVPGAAGASATGQFGFGKAQFWQVASGILDRVVETQSEAIHQAARIFADAIDRGGVVHAYGTGHSKAFAMELANRAGGLVPINRLDSVDLILACWPAEQVLRPDFELDPEVAPALLGCYQIESDDAFIIASNSGVNPSIVGVALRVKEQNHPLVAVTSLEHTRQVPSLDSSGKKLYEVADVVIDNCGPLGDALLELAGGGKACSISSLSGALIGQMLTAETIGILLERGHQPPVLISANVPGGREADEKLRKQYAGRIR